MFGQWRSMSRSSSIPQVLIALESWSGSHELALVASDVSRQVVVCELFSNLEREMVASHNTPGRLLAELCQWDHRRKARNGKRVQQTPPGGLCPVRAAWCSMMG